MVLTVNNIVFGYFSNFSGSTYYFQLIFQFYNVFFTLFLMLFFTIMDKKYTPTQLLQNPQLYSPGQQNQFFNFRLFLLYNIKGIVIGIIIFFISFAYLENQLVNTTNIGLDIFLQSTIEMFGVVLSVNLTLIWNSNCQKTNYTFILIATLLIYVFFMWICSVSGTNLESSFMILVKTPSVYLFIFTMVLVSLVEYQLIYILDVIFKREGYIIKYKNEDKFKERDKGITFIINNLFKK